MEKDINDCINKLSEKKDKYPNITFLWLNIMNYRIRMLKYSLKEIKELDFSILKTLVFQKLETEGNVSRLLGWVGVDYESQSAQNGQPQEEFKKRIILLQLFHKSEIGEWY